MAVHGLARYGLVGRSRRVAAGPGTARLGQAVKARHGGLRRVRVWRDGLGTVGQVSAR